MRNKTSIINKIESIQSKLRVLNLHLGTNNRDESYASLDKISNILGNILTLLNTETQD